MATKTFNDICVEYAHQLGKGLPLTAPEMCNAVIMYLNQQVEVMNQLVQTALNAVKDLQTEIADIDLSDYVTLNTDQTINGEKTFKGYNSFNILDSALVTVKDSLNLDSGIIYTYGSQYSAQFPNKTGTVVYTSDLSGYAKLSGSNNNWTGRNTFRGELYCVLGNTSFKDDSIIHATMINNERYKSYGSLTDSDDICISGKDIVIYAPNKPRYMSYPSNKIVELLTSEDIPNLVNYNGNIDIINSATGNGISVHNTSKTSPHTKYKYNKIEIYSNPVTLQYTLNIPNKNGTLALLSDIKNFNYSSFLATDNSNTAVSFACITTTNLGGEIAYSELNSTISGLGYNDENNVLPASGIINSKNVYGIWSDGSTIHCLCTDFTQEDLPDNATTTVKSV